MRHLALTYGALTCAMAGSAWAQAIQSPPSKGAPVNAIMIGEPRPIAPLLTPSAETGARTFTCPFGEIAVKWAQTNRPDPAVASLAISLTTKTMLYDFPVPVREELSRLASIESVRGYCESEQQRQALGGTVEIVGRARIPEGAAMTEEKCLGLKGTWQGRMEMTLGFGSDGRMRNYTVRSPTCSLPDEPRTPGKPN